MEIQIHMVMLRTDSDTKQTAYGRESWENYWEIVLKLLPMEKMEERLRLMIRIWKAVTVCLILRQVLKPMHHWILLY